MLYACRFLAYELQMLEFSFCILLEIMERGKWFRCSQPWLFGIFESQKHCLLNIRVRSKFSHLEYSVLLLEMRSYRYNFWTVCGKFKHRRRRVSFRFQRRAEIKPRSILSVKKFGQPWLLLTVQYLVCITVAIFAWSCVRVRPKNFLSL